MKIVIFLLGIFLAVNAEAATGTFWVNTSASGQHCVSSSTDPGSGSSSQTISQALACVGAAQTDAGAGSTVMVNNGNYDESLFEIIPNGVSGNPFTLKSVNLHGAVLRPTTGTAGQAVIYLANVVHYVVIDGMKIDGTVLSPTAHPYSGITLSTFTPIDIHDVTLTNLEVTNTLGSALLIVGDKLTITNNNVHDVGQDDLDHACYCNQTNSLIHGNSFVNATGYGLHEWGGGNPVDNNNEISGNIFSGNGFFSNASWGALIAGTNQRFFNNIMYGNNAAIIVGHFSQTTDTNYIYENTIYNNPNGTYGAILLQGQSNTFIQNNIIRASGAAWDTNFETPAGFSNNICSNTTAGCNNTDPLFVNAGANNFYLQNGSPAINNGVTLGAPYNVDYAGTLRPQQFGYDIGAYEYIPTGGGPPTGMVAFNGGSGVAMGSCGSGASVSGNDSTGKVTVGSGTVTSCVVNFSGTYGATPNCVANLGIATVPIAVATTTSGFTVSSGASNIAGDSISYMCVQKGKQ